MLISYDQGSPAKMGDRMKGLMKMIQEMKANQISRHQFEEMQINQDRKLEEIKASQGSKLEEIQANQISQGQFAAKLDDIKWQIKD